jgi:hypothetical protein
VACNSPELITQSGRLRHGKLSTTSWFLCTRLMHAVSTVTFFQ